MANVVVIYPNNDPGSRGIIQCWKEHEKDSNAIFLRNVPREIFLGLLRETKVLVGNSSAGIIEAASFGTPVIDVGPRQLGREHGPNVRHAPYQSASIARAIASVERYSTKNIYGSGNSAEKIAKILATIPITDRLCRKLIAY